MTTALAANVGRAFYSEFRKLHTAQCEAIEPIVAGRDVLVLAGTGSGKTEAVLAPLVQRWIGAMRGALGCTILYITPTRALANDLLRRVEPPLEFLKRRVGVRHGERNDLNRAGNVDLLITTPESLDVLVSKRHDALRTVRAVVVDEIHLVYNTQRGLQLAVLLRRLEAFTGNGCQVLGLSATVAKAADIWRFLRPGHEVVTVLDDDTKPLDVVIRDVRSDDEIVALVDRLSTGERVKILLFANARRECDRLGALLRDTTGFGPNTYVHHSSLDRDMRLTAEQRFQDAEKALCIATSTLELGIDIGDIDLVMLYGHPSGWESFLQRVGRGNRRLPKTNVACLVSPEHGPRFRTLLGFHALLSQIRSGRLEREQPLDIYGAFGQQILSIVSEVEGRYVRTADLADCFACWRHMDAATLEELLEGLVASSHLVRHGFKNRVGAAEQLYHLQDLRLIWGNFPLRSREIRVMESRREIGRVPATNLLKLSQGTVVRFAGRHWRIRRIRSDQIDVEPCRDTHGIELTYDGAALRMDPAMLEEMLRLIDGGISTAEMAAQEGKDFKAQVDRIGRYVGWNRIAVARDSQGHYCYFTFAGRLLNGVVAKWARLEEFHAGEIMLRADGPIDLSRLPREPQALERAATLALQMPGELSIFQGLLPANLLERELHDVWLKTKVYRRTLERLQESEQVHAPFDDVIDLCDQD